MRIELTQVGDYRSVGGVDGADLGQFTVVAGVNGAGKTHLLQAMDHGAVELTIDGEPVDPGDIMFHDWNSLKMNSGQEATSVLVRQEAEQLVRQIRSQLTSGKAKQALDEERERLQSGLPTQDLLKAPPSELELEDGLDLELRQLRRRVNGVLHEVLNERFERLLTGVEERTEALAVELDYAVILSVATTLQFADDPLRQELNRVFLAYQQAWEKNEYAMLRAESGKEPDAAFLSEQEFTETYGPRPWESVNALLVDMGVDLEVVEPEPREDRYEVRLRQRSDGRPVGLEHLSSGEQVLTALVLSLYGATGMPQTVRLPRVMLLDEVDAPLHPEMIRTLMRLIKDLLLDNHVAVVLTTHSPTTVALAPDGTVLQMNKTAPRLVRTSNRSALAHLTSGITALSVSYADRRVVFTEASDDADAYSIIFDALGQLAEIERGLIFLPAGTSDTHSGSSVVVTEVRRLREAGVSAAFGVLDRDEANESADDGSILVVGQPGRYTLENYLFDPLLLAAVLTREGRADDVDGLADVLPARVGTYRGLGDARADVLQAVADVMIGHLPDLEAAERRDCQLAGGEVVSLPTELLDEPGHELFERWCDAVPALRMFKTEDQLLKRILRQVVPEVPLLLSQDHLDLMEALSAG